ncbi:MAG: hypothetical protein IJQ97_05305 [Paludibacteraceae bacterium]|nr:hypothetical protein [Paludibacteraceae bacterium]
MNHTFAFFSAVLISIALGGSYSFAAATTPWNGTAQAPANDGTTYIITAPEHLAWVAAQSQSDDFFGKVIRLDADLDLGGMQALPPSWEPIGSAAKPFRGELDGNNHVIYNLYILNSFPTAAGLIAETGAEAVIHNLGIAQGQIMTDATGNVGAFVGIHRGHMHHCFNMAQLIAHNGDNVGGLVGTNYGKIEYAYNCGIITDANSHVGGLVGANKSSAVLNECYNSGYCKGADHIGALFGINEAPAAHFTLLCFDQQVTRTYATGYGTADALDNTLYAIEKSATFFSAATPYHNRSEWLCITNGHYRYPRLKCFADHEAALLSTAAIALDADNLPIERAEGVGAPMQGNLPRKSFALLGSSTTVWASSSEDVIRIQNTASAQVVRPCGNQEVILTATEGSTSKQFYTIVKGYEKFNAGTLSGSVTACWREEDVRILNANHEGKEPLGGKDDEQDGAASYQYMLIRDTVFCDEHNLPVASTPMDTLYLSHSAYRAYCLPTDVAGTYAFRRYTHDYQCTTDWTESPGRLQLTVLNPFDAGELFVEPDTIYGVPQTFTIHSAAPATGGAGVFSYLWQAVTPSGTKNPVYIDGLVASADTLNYTFAEPGEYTFTRRAADATCNTTPVESAQAHSVYVLAAVEPGAIDSFALTLCHPRYSATLNEADTASGGNGHYTYRWLCNGEPIFHSDTCSLPLGAFPMAEGGTYIFRRQVMDNSGYSAWATSAGSVTIIIDGSSEDCQIICPVVEIEPLVDMCQSDTVLAIRFRVTEGEPDSYDLVFPTDALQAGFTSVTAAELPADSIIAISLPDGAPVGTFYISLTFYTAGTACKGSAHFFPFTLLTDGFVHQKWDDLLFVDNNPANGSPAGTDDLRFVAFQWYKNGVRLPDATDQYYRDPEGLNGAYQVYLTGSDGLLYRSCVYDYTPADAGSTQPDSAGDTYYTIDGRPCARPTAPGIYITNAHKLFVR